MAGQQSPTGLELLKSKIDGFRANAARLRQTNVQEAVIRQEYIDPFFAALGWDVGNSQQLPPDEKEVVIEAHVGTTENERLRSRRPDYLFRIHGYARFVVEAKKPAVDLARDAEAIFQAKTYAWNAQIPFAILTDFEEFRVFDATIKPHFDEPRRGLLTDFDLRYEDYVAQWDVLLNTFGREAVADGSLERLFASIKKVRAGRRIRGIDRMLIDVRGVEPVDRDFLAFLEEFRTRFARDMYQENRSAFPEADTRHGAARLAEAAQRLIDRLVFMRVCEDRDIGPWGKLRASVERAEHEHCDLYPLLNTEFRVLDREYNGYLFKPHFSEQLTVSSQLLADFVRQMYPPDGPYRFDVIGDDLLGTVYERFLGSVITVNGTRVDAEQKPELRHAEGVYYTPRFVVDTIIRRTVGPKVKNLSPQEVLKVKILDMACGSGSFLVAAFQYLLDHCTRYIGKHPEAAQVPATERSRKKKKNIAFKDDEGLWRLAPDFRADLLTNCIFGVDIDAQAVEVTIMSLYLKMLEQKLPMHWQRDWLENQLLPSLDNNIRCGNSLLSQMDFDQWWEHEHGGLFAGSDELRFRINAFDWKSETRGFGRLLRDRGGFDCIIGNPPYIRVQELKKWAPEECAFYKWRYRSAARGNYDIYVPFMERGIELLAPEAVLGYICPHKFWQATYGQGLRELIAEGGHLRSIIDFGDQQVFDGATTYTAVHILGKESNSDEIDVLRITELTDGATQCASIGRGPLAAGVQHFKSNHPTSDGPWHFHDAQTSELLERVRRGTEPLFPNVFNAVFQGIVTGADPIFLSTSWAEHPRDRSLVRFFSEAENNFVDIERAATVPVVRRQGFDAFVALPQQRLILPYDTETEDLLTAEYLSRHYPKAWEYLGRHRLELVKREQGRFREEWWSLSRAQNIARWCGPKILVPYMVERLQAVFDPAGAFFVNVTTGGYGLLLRADVATQMPPDGNLYFVGLLNSRLLDYCMRRISNHFHGGYYPANKQYLQHLPIKLPRTTEERNQARRVIERVGQIVQLKPRLQLPGISDAEKNRLERQIESLEAQIDEIVCRLYGVDEVPKA